MTDDKSEIAGRTVGTITSALLGMITWEQIADTMIITTIGALIGGTVGFFVTKGLQAFYKYLTKSDEKDNTK